MNPKKIWRRSQLAALLLTLTMPLSAALPPIVSAAVQTNAASQQSAVMQKVIIQGAQELPVQAIVDQSAGSVSKNAAGQWVCPTIKQALAQIKKMKLDSAAVLLKPGIYREKLTIKQPNLTLAGMTSPEYTMIVFDDAEGTPVRPEDAASGRKLYGLSGSPTFKIHEDAVNFQAVNLTFSNDFVPEDHPEMKNRQALAIKNSSDGSSFWNCRFLGRQDTLYADAGRQYYKNCYIEGDVDFIFGAGTAVFEDCEIHSVNREGDVKGFVTAPSTPAGKPGFLFNRCHLTCGFDDGVAYLGRPWHPSSAQSPVSSAVTFRNCLIEDFIAEDGWSPMANKGGISEPKDNRMFEYQNTGDGAGITKARRQLSEAQAKDYTTKAFFSGWVPETVFVR